MVDVFAVGLDIWIVEVSSDSAYHVTTCWFWKSVDRSDSPSFPSPTITSSTPLPCPCCCIYLYSVCPLHRSLYYEYPLQLYYSFLSWSAASCSLSTPQSLHFDLILLPSLYLQNYLHDTAMQAAHLLPMFISRILSNVIVGLVATYIPIIQLVGASSFHSTIIKVLYWFEVLQIPVGAAATTIRVSFSPLLFHQCSFVCTSLDVPPKSTDRSVLLCVICVGTCIAQPSKYWGLCWMAQLTSM